MFVDENNNQISGLSRIPGGISTPESIRAAEERDKMRMTNAEIQEAQRLRAGQCGRRLLKPVNTPPSFATTNAKKVEYYETRIPRMTPCMRAAHTQNRSQFCQDLRVEEGGSRRGSLRGGPNNGCLPLTIFTMLEEYRRVKRAAEIDRNVERNRRQAEEDQQMRDGEMLARLLGQAVQNERERRKEARELAKIASTRNPLLTSFQAGKSAVNILDTVDPLARFRRQARTGTPVTPDIMPMPTLPGFTPQGRSAATDEPDPFRTLQKKPKVKFESVVPPVLDLAPQSGDLMEDFRLGRGLRPGAQNLIPPSGPAQPRGQAQPRGRVEQPLMSEEGPAEVPGSSLGVDCRGFNPADIPAYIAQCRISLEGDNALETSMLPPEQQPCNVLMACGGPVPPRDSVINAIIGCAEDPTFDSPACDLLETVLSQEYSPQASFPVDPGVSVPPDQGGGPPNMSIPPDGPPVVVVPTPDPGVPGVPGVPGQPPRAAIPVQEKDDKTMLYVGLGAAALVAVYLITQRRR